VSHTHYTTITQHTITTQLYFKKTPYKIVYDTYTKDLFFFVLKNENKKEIIQRARLFLKISDFQNEKMPGNYA
jgi:hypothetical protein